MKKKKKIEKLEDMKSAAWLDYTAASAACRDAEDAAYAACRDAGNAKSEAWDAYIIAANAIKSTKQSKRK